MPEDAIQRVVQALKDLGTGAPGVPYFHEGIYTPVGFERANFRVIGNLMAGIQKKIVCVDGGNLEILSTPGFSISVIRVAGIAFKGFERAKNRFPQRVECFCIVKTVFEGKEKKFQISYFPVKEEHAEFLPGGYTLSTEPGRIEALWELNLKPLSAISNHARKYAEWFYLKRILEFLEEGDVVLRDGIFQVSDEIEAGIAKEIFEKARNRKVGLAALAKTTSLLTDTGMPVVQVLQTLADQWQIEAPWYYFPVAENLDPDVNADIYFVKFCNSMDYAFRFEVMRQTLPDPFPLLTFLHAHSQNCIFPGYPYILVAADKIARVEQKEGKPLYLRLLSLLGKDRRIRRAIKSLDAHEMISKY
ncbi:MAG: DNA double-strand break repair nuclease NurA [Thermoplasmata archaeon]|nr:DNA double-strand break repair nuclease NurA [Thermoplasmata archaeon]